MHARAGIVSTFKNKFNVMLNRLAHTCTNIYDRNNCPQKGKLLAIAFLKQQQELFSGRILVVHIPDQTPCKLLLKFLSSERIFKSHFSVKLAGAQDMSSLHGKCKKALVSMHPRGLF